MITIKRGNIFSSNCQTLVNPVNCVGIMGRGLALQFKIKYPKMFERYSLYCKNGRLHPGSLMIDKGQIPWIINFPTKNHFNENSKIEYIQKGLETFRKHYSDWKVSSIAFPLLGAGLGNLDSEFVLNCIKNNVRDLPIVIEIWTYSPIKNKKCRTCG